MKFEKSAILAVALTLVLIDGSSAFVSPKAFGTPATAKATVSDSALSAMPPVSPAEIESAANVFGSALNVAAVSVESVTSSALFIYFAEKVIDSSIPALFFGCRRFLFLFAIQKGPKYDRHGRRRSRGDFHRYQRSL